MREDGSIILTIADEFSLKIKRERKNARITQLAPTIVLIVLIISLSTLSKDFMSVSNFSSILSQLAIPLTLSVGLTFVILMGSIDLSVDGVMGLTGSIVGLLILNSKTSLNLGIFGIILAVGLGSFAGFLTGIIHVKAKLPSFIVSFAMSSIAAGVALLSYGGVPANIEDKTLRFSAFNSFIGVPLLTWIALAVVLVGYILQEHMSFGRYVFAIGVNENIPRLSGIKVDKVKLQAFIWAGTCIGLAGVMGAARLGIGEVQIGVGNLFPALTAVVLGGTSLSGGKGGVINTLLGAVIVTVLQNGLILLGVNPMIQTGIQGIIIVAAVSLSVSRGNKLITK